jgi:hypothetical protein
LLSACYQPIDGKLEQKEAWNNILLRKSVEFSSAPLPNLWNELMKILTNIDNQQIRQAYDR